MNDIYEKYDLLRSTLERVGPLLDDPANNIKCQRMIADALTQTMVPIMDLSRIFPEINKHLESKS